LENDEFAQRLARATPRVWVTPALIVANVLVWFANLASGVDPITADPRALLLWGGNYLPVTLEQPWRLLTATLLHGGVMHLALNMWALWDAGPIAERFYGNLQFLLIYLVSGLLGSLASLFFAARMSVSIGASGAVFGVVGALLAAVVTKHQHMPPELARTMRTSTLAFVGYSLFMGFAATHIDNAAHIGGLIAGFGMASVMAEKFDWDEYRRRGLQRAAFAVAIAAAALVVVWALVPPPGR